MKKTILLLCLIFCCAVAQAQRHRPAVPQELRDTFTAHCDTIDNRQVLYRSAFTHSDSGGAPALVIFLHSAGGRGNDNLSPLGMPAVKQIHTYLTDKGIKAYMIVPQCPETASWDGAAPGRPKPHWNGFDFHPPLLAPKETLKDKEPFVNHLRPLIDEYIARHGVDSSRIYVLGASMGASGVWQLISNNPHLFSGAMIASGSYRGKSYENLLATPILCTAGTEENSHDKCQKTVEKINSLHGKAVFKSLAGMGHVEACNKAFTPENLNGLFSQTR